MKLGKKKIFYGHVLFAQMLVNFIGNIVCVTGPRPSDFVPGRERLEVYNGGPGPGYAGGPQSRRPPDIQVWCFILQNVEFMNESVVLV